jgi:hypothetical protein
MDKERGVSRTLCWLGIIVFCFCCSYGAVDAPLAAQPPAATKKSESAPPATGQPKKPGATTSAKDAEEAAAKKAQADDEWSVIYMGKIRMGAIRSNSRDIVRDGKKLIRSESQSMMLIKRFGQELKMNITITSEETPEGDLIGLESHNDNPPNSFSKTTGKVVGSELELFIDSAGKRSKKTLKWDPEMRSPAYQDRMLRENPLKAGESREFKTFMPEMNQIATVTLKEKGEEEVKLFDGSSQKLKRIDITQSILPGFVTKTWVNPNGDTLKSSTPGFFGSDMTTYRVTKEEALRQVVGAELDIAIDTLIKIDPPLQRAHETQQVVYVVKINGGDPTKDLPSGNTQQLKSVGPETAEMTVTAIRPPERPTKEIAAPEYSLPNRYLQSDDKQVIAHAEAAAAGSSKPWEVAVKMEKYVHDKLTKKNFSTALASAAEVAKSMEGDCTEHACLLAAMCRVKNIPSRAVVGLVYADRYSAFGGHMWTEVFIDGTWIPIDATLGQGGIGAAHIKVSDTSFSDDGPDAKTSFLPILKIIGNTTLKVKTVQYRQ